MLYVPGNSIKGALRTAYENYYFSMLKTEERCNNIKKAVSEKNYKKALNNENSNANVNTFNKLEITNSKRDAVNDVFRGIRISDSKPVSVENLILNGYKWLLC